MYEQVAARWDDELIVGDIVLRYYLPDETHSLIVLKSDRDVANMYIIYMLNGVLQAKFVVEKKGTSTQAPAPTDPPQPPQPQESLFATNFGRYVRRVNEFGFITLCNSGVITFLVSL